MTSQFELYVDGASRNNPGPAGAGIYLLKDGKPIERRGYFLGVKTNNQAEYLALLLGLVFATEHMKPEDHLVIKADSLLMIKQISGQFKVKNPGLFKIYQLVMKFLLKIQYKAVHIPREENKQADRLANLGVDRKQQVPEELMRRCNAI